MNLKLMVYVSLIILVLSSLLIFGFISYSAYSEKTKKGDAFFKDNSWLFYTNIGVEVAVLVIVGLLFIKR